MTLKIYDETGTKISSIGSVEEGIPPFTMDGDLRMEFNLPQLGLFPGRYLIGLEVKRPNDPVEYYTSDDVLLFEVQPAIVRDAMWAYDKPHGIVRLAQDARVLPKNAAAPVGMIEEPILRAV